MGKRVKKLEDKEYCCPFCSHGWDIWLMERDKRRIVDNQLNYYLKCDGCFEYPVREYIGITFTDQQEKEAIERAYEIFRKMIEHSKGGHDFILSR